MADEREETFEERAIRLGHQSVVQETSHWNEGEPYGDMWARGTLKGVRSAEHAARLFVDSHRGVKAGPINIGNGRWVVVVTIGRDECFVHLFGTVGSAILDQYLEKGGAAGGAAIA